jgi:hypothetical protein
VYEAYAAVETLTFVNVLAYNFWISWREGTARTLKDFDHSAFGRQKAILTRVKVKKLQFKSKFPSMVLNNRIN